MCGDPGIARVTSALSEIGEGKTIEVICDNRDQEFTAAAIAKKNGHEVLAIRREGKESFIIIKKGPSIL